MCIHFYKYAQLASLSWSLVLKGPLNKHSYDHLYRKLDRKLYRKLGRKL